MIRILGYSPSSQRNSKLSSLSYSRELTLRNGVAGIKREEDRHYVHSMNPMTATLPPPLR